MLGRNIFKVKNKMDISIRHLFYQKALFCLHKISSLLKAISLMDKNVVSPWLR
jgi:hypothetical protein